MPISVTIHEAKTKLSELIRRVEAGEEVIIKRGDEPVAVLSEFKKNDVTERRAAAFGVDKGKYPPVPDEVFFGPMSDEEFIEMFGQDYYDLVKGTEEDDPADARIKVEP